MKELRCPQCGCTNIQTERRLNGLHKCLFCFRSWTNGTIIPIESQKPPFQDEPFPGYIDSLKARIVELESTVQEACDLLNDRLEWGNCTEKGVESMCEFINKHDRDAGGKP